MSEEVRTKGFPRSLRIVLGMMAFVNAVLLGAAAFLPTHSQFVNLLTHPLALLPGVLLLFLGFIQINQALKPPANGDYQSRNLHLKKVLRDAPVWRIFLAILLSGWTVWASLAIFYQLPPFQMQITDSLTLHQLSAWGGFWCTGMAALLLFPIREK